MPSGAGVAAGLNYADSVDSSPRSRGAESWDEPFPTASPAATKHRLMCSYGGRIVPRPTDKSLCYLGGETRMVVVERHASLADLSARLSTSLLSGRPFTLKYQLPNEDLDSLISVTTDEDLENMIEEYDRISAAASSSSRLRLFLFPAKTDSATSSIGSLVDDSKSESWFVDALNGAMAMRMPRVASAGVNSLLGLEDDASVQISHSESSSKLPRHTPEVLDNSSSFGSACSAPSINNLPPIRTRPEADQRIVGIDDQFRHMNLSSAVSEGQEMIRDTGFAAPQSVALQSATVSATENSSKLLAADEEKLEEGRLVLPPAQQKPTPADALVADSTTRPMYYQDTSSPPVPVPSLDQKREVAVSDSSYHGYLMPQMQPEQLQQQHYYQQQPQQFIHPNPHYIHPGTGTVLPVPSYYHPIQQSQQYDPQIPMYFMPMRPTAPYNLASVQPNVGDAAPTSVKPMAAPAPLPSKAELAANLYRTTAATPPPQAPLIHLTAEQAHPYPSMGYHMMQQQPSQAGAAMVNYGYEYSDPSQQPRIYYTQNSPLPTYASQYQTMVSTAGIPDVAAAPQLQTGEVKQARAS